MAKIEKTSGPAWTVYDENLMTLIRPSLTGSDLVIKQGGDMVFLTKVAAEALLSILPDAIAALKQNSA